MTSAKLGMLLALLCVDAVSGRYWADPVAQRQEDTGADLKQSDLDFKEVLMGERAVRHGSSFPFHTWKSADGVIVESSIQEFNSTIQAKSAFSNRVKQASRIIQTGSRLSKDGRKTGERAVVVFSDQRPEHEIAGILWTDGRVFHEVESVSLRHAKAFEQQMYPAAEAHAACPARRN